MSYILMIAIGFYGHTSEDKRWTYAGEYTNLEQCQISAKLLKPTDTKNMAICLPKGIKQ